VPDHWGLDCSNERSARSLADVSIMAENISQN
jgi:hypothetical protein